MKLSLLITLLGLIFPLFAQAEAARASRENALLVTSQEFLPQNVRYQAFITITAPAVLHSLQSGDIGILGLPGYASRFYQAASRLIEETNATAGVKASAWLVMAYAQAAPGLFTQSLSAIWSHKEVADILLDPQWKKDILAMLLTKNLGAAEEIARFESVLSSLENGEAFGQVFKDQSGVLLKVDEKAEDQLSSAFGMNIPSEDRVLAAFKRSAWDRETGAKIAREYALLQLIYTSFGQSKEDASYHALAHIVLWHAEDNTFRQTPGEEIRRVRLGLPVLGEKSPRVE